MKSYEKSKSHTVPIRLIIETALLVLQKLHILQYIESRAHEKERLEHETSNKMFSE